MSKTLNQYGFPLRTSDSERPLRLLDYKILRGSNRYFRNTVIRQSIDCGAIALLTNHDIGAKFTRKLVRRFRDFPAISDRPFDRRFIRRLKSEDGVSIEEILLTAMLGIECAVARTIRNISFEKYGRVFPNSKSRRYELVWSSMVGRMSREAAILGCLGIYELLPKKFRPDNYHSEEDYETRFAKLLKAARRRQRNLDANALAYAAEQRGLPSEFIGTSYLVLGHGIAQQVIHESCINREADLTDAEAGRKRSLQGFAVQADQSVSSLKVDISDPSIDTLYRLLVINAKIVAALKITPPVIRGNGRNTIHELIRAKNKRMRRHGITHFPILLNKNLKHCLEENQLNLDSVLTEKSALKLKHILQIEDGAEFVDAYEELHPDVYNVAVKTVKDKDLSTAAIDVWTSDAADLKKSANVCVGVVNTNPPVWPYVWPQAGTPRDVGQHVLENIYPAAHNGRIPILMVVGKHGTNRVGHATEHLLRNAGAITALATKNKSFARGKSIRDRSSLPGNTVRDLLHDSRSEVVIGTKSFRDLARKGLGIQQIDAAAILDREPGESLKDYKVGISVLIQATLGAIIVSSENEIALTMLKNVPRSRIILISHNLRNPYIDLQRQHDGVTLVEVTQDDYAFIALLKGGVIEMSEQIDRLPKGDDTSEQKTVEHMFCLALAYASGLSFVDSPAASEETIGLSLNSAQRVMQ